MGGLIFRIVIEYECSRKYFNEDDKIFIYCIVFCMLFFCVCNVINDDDVLIMV